MRTAIRLLDVDARDEGSRRTDGVQSPILSLRLAYRRSSFSSSGMFTPPEASSPTVTTSPQLSRHGSRLEWCSNGPTKITGLESNGFRTAFLEFALHRHVSGRELRETDAGLQKWACCAYGQDTVSGPQSQYEVETIDHELQDRRSYQQHLSGQSNEVYSECSHSCDRSAIFANVRGLGGLTPSRKRAPPAAINTPASIATCAKQVQAVRASQVGVARTIQEQGIRPSGDVVDK